MNKPLQAASQFSLLCQKHKIRRFAIYFINYLTDRNDRFPYLNQRSRYPFMYLNLPKNPKRLFRAKHSAISHYVGYPAWEEWSCHCNVYLEIWCLVAGAQDPELNGENAFQALCRFTMYTFHTNCFCSDLGSLSQRFPIILIVVNHVFGHLSVYVVHYLPL